MGNTLLKPIVKLTIGRLGDFENEPQSCMDSANAFLDRQFIETRRKRRNRLNASHLAHRFLNGKLFSKKENWKSCGFGGSFRFVMERGCLCSRRFAWIVPSSIARVWETQQLHSYDITSFIQ
ncbi:hypothetical protein LSTR_LSTR008712 [Laodelphax striatellus]|uniref:Uncharacterized protein n=1 Tax=Laodelphax striatellus TaxID=195883 RepID=A0A482XM60_LAOST|nr:hypothetical protein LSTR_LSTR008712 [Laodelphax striatellus]